MNLFNAKRKSYDYRNTSQFNEIKVEESNQNDKEEISISKLQLANDNLKKILNQKDAKIKELENQLKENNNKNQELKNINKEENKEVLNEKVEQRKINSENINNYTNDNNKKEQDKKEINEKLENKNDVKDDNIKINNEKMYEILLEILDYNKKIYQNQINEKKQSKEVGVSNKKEFDDINKKELGETIEKLDNQDGNDENKNLNNKNDTSNNINRNCRYF